VRLDPRDADRADALVWYMRGTPPWSRKTPGNFMNEGRSLIRSSQNFVGRRVRAAVVAFPVATSAVTGPAPSKRSR